MTGKISYLTWGNGSQLRCFQDFSGLLDDLLYLPDLADHDLTGYAAVIVPEGMNADSVRPHARALNDYVRQGGFLIIFALRGVEDWLDVVDISWRPTLIKDWLWWQKSGQRPEIYQPRPRHPICTVIPEQDMAWHCMGVYAPHEQAVSALNLDDDSASHFLDFQNLPGNGRLIFTSLDPHVHHGERFMPATTRFLKAFFPWLNRELAIDRRPRKNRLTYVQCLDRQSEWHPDTLEEIFYETGISVGFYPAI